MPKPQSPTCEKRIKLKRPYVSKNPSVLVEEPKKIVVGRRLKKLPVSKHVLESSDGEESSSGESSSGEDDRITTTTHKKKISTAKRSLKNKESDLETEIHSDVDLRETDRHPSMIRELLTLCLKEVNEIKSALKNRERQKYKNVFENYKSKLSEKEYSIIRGGLDYLYTHSRINSIDKDKAVWMMGIFEIPTSHIISYTSKEILQSIAKDHGLPVNKNAKDLVENIRKMLTPSR
jgi:hypothetical protein